MIVSGPGAGRYDPTTADHHYHPANWHAEQALVGPGIINNAHFGGLIVNEGTAPPRIRASRGSIASKKNVKIVRREQTSS